ncbi:MAG: S41 family peptidase [Endomicrobium sp.]|jgi:carboxyl-terminal processing protease|nr:S41 family peptidase [Endomicrobium sp.]
MKLRKKTVLAAIFLFLCSVNIFAVSDETYDKLKLMIEVMELIDTDYAYATNSKDLAVGAIKGVVAELDPFSQYIEKKVCKELENEFEGVYVGMGIVVTVRNNSIITISSIPGTCAYKAGILPEDRIIKINDKSVIDIDEAFALMQGKVGEKIKITVLRSNVPGEIEFNLVREKIKIETMMTTLLDGGIAYIRIANFDTLRTDDNIKKALTDYKKRGMRALILDLRNNPGGLLVSALNIIDMFIKDKMLVLTLKGRDGEIKKEYFTTGGGEFSDIPLVILVNGRSASVSEMIPGAMQDFRRALIIGNNTFGKGSSQKIIPLSDGTGLILTVARYYLPSGRTVKISNYENAKDGITPDIEVNVTAEEEAKLYEQGEEIIFTKDKDRKPSVARESKVEDKVLNKALEIIKEGKVAKMIESSTVLNNVVAEENGTDKKEYFTRGMTWRVKKKRKAYGLKYI